MTIVLRQNVSGSILIKKSEIFPKLVLIRKTTTSYTQKRQDIENSSWGLSIILLISECAVDVNLTNYFSCRRGVSTVLVGDFAGLLKYSNNNTRSVFSNGKQFWFYDLSTQNHNPGSSHWFSATILLVTFTKITKETKCSLHIVIHNIKI